MNEHDQNKTIQVIRKCTRCGRVAEESEFTYLGDGVWSCFCGSKWTVIAEILEGEP